MSLGIPAEERRLCAPRRILRREEAATYVALSPSKFDQLVKDGRMPKPKKIDGCVRWDKRALDLVLDELFTNDDANEWDVS